MDDQTFELVRECFAEDDGSLPGIELTGLSADEVAGIYACIRRRSRVSRMPPELWIISEERPIPSGAVTDPAASVASQEAAPFHVCLEGLVVGDVELPELGLFVFPDTVELDYRMGHHWTREKVAALFQLLRELCAIAPNADLRMPTCEYPPHPDRFLLAWARYRDTSG